MKRVQLPLRKKQTAQMAHSDSDVTSQSHSTTTHRSQTAPLSEQSFITGIDKTLDQRLLQPSVTTLNFTEDESRFGYAVGLETV